METDGQRPKVPKRLKNKEEQRERRGKKERQNEEESLGVGGISRNSEKEKGKIGQKIRG